MRKEYMTPGLTVIEMDTGALLAGSGQHGHGRENACAHGSHAWFCDDEDDDD